MASKVVEALLERLDNRLNKLEDKFSSKLDSIMVQTTKTNGRVTALEKFTEDISHQQSSLKRRVISLEENDKISAAVSNAKNKLVDDNRDRRRYIWSQIKPFIPWLIIGLVTLIAALVKLGVL